MEKKSTILYKVEFQSVHVCKMKEVIKVCVERNKGH